MNTAKKSLIYRNPVTINDAMLRAHPILARAISSRMEDNNLYLTDVSSTKFQLILAPVWLVTITELDKDTRSVLVNGQSSRIILGKSQRP